MEICQRTSLNLEVQLYCTKGCIRISDYETNVYLESEENREVTSRTLSGVFDYSSGMVRAVEELVGLVENDGESVSSGREALRTLEIMIAVMRSQAQGAEKITWPLAR